MGATWCIVRNVKFRRLLKHKYGDNQAGKLPLWSLIG